MEPLERVFKDADNVALSSLVSTVQFPGGPGPATQASPANPAAVSMFDDDLDVGAPAAVSGTNRCDGFPMATQAGLCIQQAVLRTLHEVLHFVSC